MKIFVPRRRYLLPHVNDHILNRMFVEVKQSDLPCVVQLWRGLDEISEAGAVDNFFQASVSDVCSSIEGSQLEPYLRRPHITVHCGSKVGGPDIQELARQTLYELGYLIAQYGFNLWYGGGKDGLMGVVHQGFRDGLKEQRFQDQYSVQVSAARFAVPCDSNNGLSPANEELCQESDIALVLPDFVTRREVLSNKCAAAVACVGALGTLDETTDLLAHIKIGERKMHSYIINTHVPADDCGYFDDFIAQIHKGVRHSLEKPQVLEYFHVQPAPQAMMAHLMERLDHDGQNPHMVYEAYCRENKIDIASNAVMGTAYRPC